MDVERRVHGGTGVAKDELSEPYDRSLQSVSECRKADGIGMWGGGIGVARQENERLRKPGWVWQGEWTQSLVREGGALPYAATLSA